MTTVMVVGKLSSEELRDNARNFYGQMQQSWYFFAKTVSEIRDSEVFKELGFDSFKEFCEEEFPSMHYSTIIKTVRVALAWGKALEKKMEEEETYKLPAYESCYQLITAEKKLPNPEFVKLRTEVLDGKVGYNALREKIKTVEVSKKQIAREAVSEELDDFEKELEKEIEGDEEFLGEEITEEETEIFTLISKTKRATEVLTEDVKKIHKWFVKNETMSHDIVELGYSLEETGKNISDFITKLEEVSNG